MADLTTNTATSTGGYGSNGFEHLSRKQNEHVELFPWIEDMINIIEPKDCSIRTFHKLDRFCIKCVQLFCNECGSGDHDGHEHLQIYRNAYSCVVKRSDFQKHFECSGIQSYKANGRKMIYITQKRVIQQVKEEQINTKKVSCIVCNLSIIDDDYCSVECKVSAVYKNGNTEWVTYDKSVQSSGGVIDDNDVSNIEEAKDYNNVRKRNGEESKSVLSDAKLILSKIKRHRKAIPFRSPLF